MKILKKYKLEDFLFIDIETVHGDNSFSEESPMYDAWRYDKVKGDNENITNEELIELYYKEAPLYSEYGKIVCITIGMAISGEIRIKSFYGDDEKVLLTEFNELLDTFVTSRTWLCGHAVTQFDAPWIMRRCLVNDLEPNMLFDVAHLKPWEVQYMDTQTLWKSTSWRPTSLIALATSLGIPSPKDDISGKDVGRVYYEGGLDRIVTYCEKDVKTVISIVKKLRFEKEEVEPEKVGVLTYLFEGGKYTEEVRAELLQVLKPLNKTETKKAFEILNTLPTKAKNKETDITKKDIQELSDFITNNK
jgi:hypothetical protein